MIYHFPGGFFPLFNFYHESFFGAPLIRIYIVFEHKNINYVFFCNVIRSECAHFRLVVRNGLRPSSGNFLRVESCYPESFWFLCHCFNGGWRLWSWKNQEQEVGKTIWPDSDSDSLHHDMTGNGWSWINWELLLYPTFNLSQEPQLNVGQCLGWSC